MKTGNVIRKRVNQKVNVIKMFPIIKREAKKNIHVVRKEKTGGHVAVKRMKRTNKWKKYLLINLSDIKMEKLCVILS